MPTVQVGDASAKDNISSYTGNVPLYEGQYSDIDDIKSGLADELKKSGFTINNEINESVTNCIDIAYRDRDYVVDVALSLTGLWIKICK